MPELSSADHFSSLPVLEIPRNFNAAHDLIARNLEAGRQDHIAFIDDYESITYREFARRVDRFASGLLASGVEPEDRILVCMLDTIDWPIVFLGAIKAGVVPVCVNTMLTQNDYDFMLRDSRAKVLFVSRALFPAFD
ncbi:MAG: AMP-binding protein, partial [Lautropia sp.]